MLFRDELECLISIRSIRVVVVVVVVVWSILDVVL